ncbi:MAG TPA: prepilin-type N-terminal cleavage/methylation domain-containing protein [Candidatus Saccharimonadales bacterium]
MKFRSARAQGFTVIELLVVIVVVCILGMFVSLAYSGVQAKNNNTERQKEVDLIKRQLEAYSAEAQVYPTLAQLNDPAWRAQHLKHVSDGDIQDPRWNNATAACTANKKAVFAATPTADCYSYQVTASDGNACDNGAIACAHYTLTAELEGGGTYVKTSLN